MSDVLDLLADAFYNVEAQIPPSFYEVKKQVTKMRLSYTKIDACEHDCMLYCSDDAALEKCKRCNSDRYTLEGQGKWTKKRPKKSMRYLPLGPRLQRLYMSAKMAKHMR